MDKKMNWTALATAALLLLTASGFARADDRYVERRGMSTTEKVIAGVTVAAVVGLAAYALTRDDDHRHYNQPRAYRGRTAPRGHVAIEFGYRPYTYGGPHQNYRGQMPRGYWVDFQSRRFWRTPYAYNGRYDGAFNAGWERGYWAGYLQGLHDSGMRARFHDGFDWQGRSMWGYSPRLGPHDSYRAAFMQAYRIGYRHAFHGNAYGHEGFGFGGRYGY